MRPADPLPELLEELRGLGNRALRDVLGRLSEAEQSQILALLDEPKVSEPAFEALAGLSPWLLERLESARSRGSKTAGFAITDATRNALLEAQQQLAKSEGSPPRTSARPGRSLVSRFFTGPRRKRLAA